MFHRFRHPYQHLSTSPSSSTENLLQPSASPNPSPTKPTKSRTRSGSKSKSKSKQQQKSPKSTSAPTPKMRLSPATISALCLLVTGVYAQEGPHGIDTGNNVCVGSCVKDPHLLSCDVTTAVVYKPVEDCFRCCISDDHADDWADHIGEGPDLDADFENGP